MASENMRKLVLWGALAATLLAVVWVEDESEQDIAETAEAIEPARHSKSGARVDRLTSESLPIEQLGKRKFNAEADDIFTITTWEPQRSTANATAPGFVSQQLKASAPPPVPAPVAPPLQFKYLGRITEGQETHIFLSQADKNHVAKVGGRIEDQYRIDRIMEDSIELTYLPLGIRQTLLINDKNPGRIQ
jgi:hypothetical protein